MKEKLKQALMIKLAAGQQSAAQMGLIASNVAGQLVAAYIQRRYKNLVIKDEERIKKYLETAGYSRIAKDPIKFSKFKILLSLPQVNTTLSAGKLFSGLGVSALVNPLKEGIVSKVINPIASSALSAVAEMGLGASSELVTGRVAEKLKDRYVTRERVAEVARKYGDKLR